MNLYVDLATRRIVFSPKLNKELARVDVKRGDVFPLSIVFLSNGKPVQITTGSEIVFCAKKKNDFDADPLVLSNNFALIGASTDNPRYDGLVQLTGVDLNDYLDNVIDKADDLVFADLHSEINWSNSSGSLTTNTLILRVYNDIYKSGDGDPELIVGQPFVFPNGLRIPSLTTGNIVLVGASGLLQDISRNGVDTRSSFPPSSHTHGNITNDGKIGTLANLVVTTTTAGLLTTSSRSGIDTRTSFPNDDVTAATTTGAAGQLLRLNSAGNTVAKIYIASEGIELGEEGGEAGFIRILNANGDVVTINNANASNAEISFPLGSGTLALTSDITNSVTSATTSNGTANLSISNVTTATATVSSLLTAAHIHGNLAGTLYTHIRTGEAMSKGDPFYISGFHVGSSQPIAMRADAANAAKMPAVGVMDADYAINTSSANGIISGTLSSVNTNGYAVNSPIYVANGGGYSNTAGTIPQQVGITERANVSTGAFIVTNSKVISFADVSDAQTGTAQLSLGDLEVVGGEIYTDGDYSQIYTQGDGAEIFTLGSTAQIYTQGENAHISTSGANANISTTGAAASIFTTGANAGISTTGANANITTEGTNAYIETLGSAANIVTAHPSASIRSSNFGATESGGASLVDGSMQPCLTWSAGGRNLTIPSGTATTFNTTSYSYGTGAAAAHRTALGVASADLQIESLFTLLTRQESDAGSFTANAGTASGGADGDTLSLSATTANQRPNVYRFRNWSRNPGNSGVANPVTPVRLASAGNLVHSGSAANGGSFRCGIGMVSGASAVAADANATTGRGFGWRIAWNSSTSKLEFNLWAHNGTTYVEGSGIDTGFNTASADNFFNVIVRLASDGTVTAHTWFGTNTAVGIPSATPSATLAGGPTSGTFANQGIPVWISAAHSTNAPSAANTIIAKIINRKLYLG